MQRDDLMIDDLVEGLEKKKYKFHELEKIAFELLGRKEDKWQEACSAAAVARLKFMERVSGKRFPNIGKSYIETAGKGTTGIENLVGGAVVPLGIGGPLKINGEYAKGEFYIPLATNEAALIAGFSRGCKAVNESGSARTLVTRNSMTRAPVLELPDAASAKKLVDAINSDSKLYSELKSASEAESKVSKMSCIQTFQIGKRVWLRFAFETGDSMGMNSVTKYTANAIKKLREHYPKAKLVALSGNMCCDKKPNHANILLGRGKSVEAEIVIKKDVLRNVYGTDARTIERINFIKNYQGSALAGAISCNANAANTIVAMFIATGQDAAQVVESSSCFVTAEDVNGDLYFSVSLPCLEVGTVGGGMGYATARECLEMIGCAGAGKTPGDNAKKLAEIIAASVLAQELNLLGALANEYELGESHVRLARGK